MAHDRAALQAFVESWGSMGLLWGVNRSIARVHALLIASDPPMSLDDVAQELGISRGNASMSLKELRAWGVVKKVSTPGDRRDFFETEPDVWKMFFQIIRERKRREFDPALAAVRAALEGVEPDADDKVLGRLRQMEDLLTTMDKLARRLLANADTSRSTLRFITGMVFGDK
jgi:HTH-type transcriptional regulator, glycine betaine synthesis regulator